MISYLERYRETALANLPNSRVWIELTSLGAGIREEPIYADAKAVARETMLRAKENVALLASRLKKLDYRYAHPEMKWVAPGSSAVQKLDALEGQYGLLPLSVRTWYEIVGTVNLAGSHPALSRYYSLDAAGSKPLPMYADPLVVDPFPSAPMSYYLNLIYEDTGEEITAPPYTLELAPDAVHKANQSGGGPTQIMFPNPAMDAPLLSDDWEGVLFVSYLRTSFEWGGFPGWRNQPDYPVRELDFLREGLLAL